MDDQLEKERERAEKLKLKNDHISKMKTIKQ